MPQKILDIDARLITRRKRRGKPPGRVDKSLRPATHTDPYAVAYGVRMSNDQPREDWAGYLRRMTSQPGWSVARLARESNIHRGTIFKWISGKGGVNVSSVTAIAEALGDDPANALRAAGRVDSGEVVDEEIELVRSDPKLDPETKVRIVTLIIERREADRRSSLAETQRLIELFRRRDEAG
jgi:hypothetical protein